LQFLVIDLYGDIYIDTKIINYINER